MAVQALLDDGDEVPIPALDYPLWTAAVTLAGGTPVHCRCAEQSDRMPSQHAVAVALGGRQSIKDLVLPGGRLRVQRDTAYDLLTQLPGVPCVKPRARCTSSRDLAPNVFGIKDDRQLVLNLLRAERDHDRPRHRLQLAPARPIPHRGPPPQGPTPRRHHPHPHLPRPLPPAVAGSVRR